jgi:hypothetical protein
MAVAGRPSRSSTASKSSRPALMVLTRRSRGAGLFRAVIRSARWSPYWALEALMQPIRQIEPYRLRLFVQLHALQAAQPFHVVPVHQGFEFAQVAAAVAGQPGQQEAARRRRRGQDLQAAQVAQHAVYRLGDEGPVAAAQLGVIAEKAGEFDVGRPVHFQDQSQRLDGGGQVQRRGLGRRLWRQQGLAACRSVAGRSWN